MGKRLDLHNLEFVVSDNADFLESLENEKVIIFDVFLSFCIHEIDTLV